MASTWEKHPVGYREAQGSVMVLGTLGAIFTLASATTAARRGRGAAAERVQATEARVAPGPEKLQIVDDVVGGGPESKRATP